MTKVMPFVDAGQLSLLMKTNEPQLGTSTSGWLAIRAMASSVEAPLPRLSFRE